jgi:hypothetical protein
MDTLKRIEGIDRYLLISTALIFFDLPQIILYFIPGFWVIGWIMGVIGAMLYGFVLNTAFNVNMFGPRMGMKALVYFIAEILPAIGMINLLSVAMFVISYFHNNNADEDEEQSG